MKEVEQHLEPRVSRVEVKLDGALGAINSLTENVRGVANALKEQGDQSVAWREKLMIAVERAGAPRRTDWQLLMTLAALIMAVGALAFTPLLWRQGETQKDVDSLVQEFDVHSKMTLHPVGQQMIMALKDDLQKSVDRNEAAIKELDTKLQREASLMIYNTEEKAKNVQVQLEILRDKSLPPLTERVAILAERLKMLENERKP